MGPRLPFAWVSGLLGPIPYDEAQTGYTAVDGDAGRSGSKVNIYRLKANFTDGTSLVSAPIVLFHQGKS